MDKNFIDNVHDIVLNHISDEKFGAKNLAELLGLSTTQTLRKVKAATGKSVNQFIREVKLAEAAKLIKETDLTSAEISYKVGFSSPSYFNKAFRKQYGVPPGGFKAKESTLDNLASQEVPSGISNKKMAIYTASICMFLLVGYFIINKVVAQTNSKPISIAVLPFKDMSPDNNQWFSDGVVEDILTNLSKVNNLRVISRTSTMQYKNTDKSVLDIAKELNVDYVLEGSARQHENNVIITAQLINAKDEHLWAENYNEKWDNIFNIQKDVAIKMVKQLKIEISPEEKENIEHTSTNNYLALQLYQRGRTLADKGYYTKSIEFFEKAIAIDSNYADAYAAMANSAFSNSRYFSVNTEEAITKANNYIEKALEINPNTGLAYTVKALILQNEKKWDLAKINFQKAIEINPNDAKAHQGFALFYSTMKPRNKELTHKHINKALELDPLSVIINKTKIRELLSDVRIQEAENHLSNISFILPNNGEVNRMKISVLYAKAYQVSKEKKDWTESLSIFEDALKENPNIYNYYFAMGDVHEGIYNDHKTALKYYEEAYKLDPSTTTEMYYFYSLLANKKFKEAAKLMQSEKFKKRHSRLYELSMVADYYYEKGEHEKSNNILIDSLDSHSVFTISRNYSKLAKKEEAYKVLYGVHECKRPPIFAALKERDSLYHYLDMVENYWEAFGANQSREMDPYRKEERYKAFLRKNNLPITHWNE